MDESTMTITTSAIRSTEQQSVEAIIIAQVEDLGDKTSAREIDRVTSSISRDIPIDYDLDWREFAVAYLLVNYRKSLDTLRLLPSRPCSTMTDVGCGTGASALAFVTFAAEQGTFPDAITLLDRSNEPMLLAQESVREALRRFKASTNVVSEWTDLAHYAAVKPQDMFLCSHVLSEQRSSALSVAVETMYRQLSPGGRIVAIERATDELWSGREFPTLPYTERHAGRVQITAPEWPARHAERQWATGWYTTLRPDPWAERVVSNYFDAWAHQDLGRLKEVFDENATYHEKPFDPPLEGIEQIEAYWINRVCPQKNVDIAIHHVSWGYLTATAEWTASFTEVDHSREVRGIIVFDLDPLNRRVVSLREAFRTSDAPVP